MSKRAASAAPKPKMGDYVVVAHQLVDPEHWWVSRVEWAAEDQYLVLDTQGWQPSHEPCLLMISTSCLAFGTKEDCSQLVAQANLIKGEHIVAIRNATVALDEAQDAAREAIRAIVDHGNRRLHGDISVIEP